MQCKATAYSSSAITLKVFSLDTLLDGESLPEQESKKFPNDDLYFFSQGGGDRQILHCRKAIALIGCNLLLYL